MGYSAEDKMKIRNQVVRDTGFPLKRVDNYLQRFNWDLKKLYDYPVIKSAVKKTKQEAAKAKALEVIDLEDETVTETKQRVPRKSKKKGVEHDKVGNEIEVHDDGSRWFRGKQIRNDSSGLYAPYLTQKEIIGWIKQYGHQDVPLYVTKLEEFNKKHNTKYKYWDDLSREHVLTERDLIEYEAFVNWHLYLKKHDESEFTEKFLKKMRDHFSTKSLGLT